MMRLKGVGKASANCKLNGNGVKAIAKALSIVLLLASSSSVLATEGGGNSYVFGVETNSVGLVPPPGLNVFTYYANYSSKHSKDNSGNDNPALAYFKVKSNAVALRVVYVWPDVQLLGASVMTFVAQAVPTIDLSLGVKLPPPRPALDRSDTETGLTDLGFTPIALGWRSPTYYQVLGLDSHMATGSYDKNNRINTGRNYYQAAPFYAFTWLPADNFDVNAKFRYAVNTTNKETNYRSGHEASVEFSAGYKVNPSVSVGLNGYIYRQTTDDELNGKSFRGDGNRGSVNSLGPYLTYSFSPKFKIIFKIQEEFGAKNRTEGTRIWLQTRIPF
jgi:hypothetical protein